MRTFLIVFVIVLITAAGGSAEEQEYLDYTVKKGDTLWDITGEKLTDPFLWPKVWKENPDIANPDLIYPGQKLKIPLFTPQKQVDIAPLEEKVEEPVMEKIVIHEAPEPEEERIQILPSQAFVVKGDLIASSGYIVDEIPAVGKVASTPTGRTVIGKDDFAYIQMTDGSRPRTGERFYALKSYGLIKHPKTGAPVGYLIGIAGLIRVTGADGGRLSAQVIKSFYEIEVGDPIDRYYPIESFPLVTRTGPDVHGTVVASRELKTVSGMYNIVYIDRGDTDGILPGNVFTLVSGNNPTFAIGKIQIINTKPKTAVALVIRSDSEVTRGDSF